MVVPQAVCPGCQTPIGPDHCPKHYGMDALLLPATVSPPLCLCSETEHAAAAKCIQCDQYLCFSLAAVHTKAAVARNHVLVTLPNLPLSEHALGERPSNVCPLHDNEPYRLYDTACRVPVCVLCVATTHATHPCVSLTKAAADGKMEVQAAVPPVRVRADLLEATAATLQTRMHSLQRDVSSKQTDLLTIFHKVHPVCVW